MNYSVGIPVRNEENTLETCVQSVLAQTVAPTKVYICLNGSNEATWNVATQLRADERVQLLTSAPGKARAWNEIVRASETNEILFTDGDALVPNNAAEKFYEAFNAHSGACVAGADICYVLPPGIINPFIRNATGKRLPTRNLTGQLYMMRKHELLTAARELDIALMPEDIIAEDSLIGGVAHATGRYVAADTYVQVHPPTTLRDIAYFRRRSNIANQELQERFPQLYDDGQIRGVDPVPTWSHLPLAPRLAYRAVRSILGMGLAITDYWMSKTSNGLWTELKSTKVPFSPAHTHLHREP